MKNVILFLECKDDVNYAYSSFLDIFTKLYNQECPLIKIKKCGNKNDKDDNKPWLTKGIKNACKKKNQLYKNFLQKRSEAALYRYKTYKNSLVTILRKVKSQYYKDKLNKFKGDVKGTWKMLNELLNKKKRDQPMVSSFMNENKCIDNKKEISNEFNKFFIKIGPTMAEKIPRNVRKHYLDYISKQNDKTIFLQPVTEQEIFNIVNNFQMKHSCGYDNISMYIIKNVIKSIVKPLVHIFNMSLVTGIFPDDMKISKIIPIYKAEENNLFCNYRPISLLSQFSKILEKIFNNRLLNFINVNNILCNRQYGFRKNYSTELAVLETIEKISTSLDNKRYSIEIFIDLKKAFDTLNHQILIEKLKFYGIRGIASQWLNSYLKNRKQFVLYNNVESDMGWVRCGVPQGSILGPSLFLLYINDLCNVSELLQIVLFADDTNIFYEHVDKTSLEHTLNIELNKINTWFMVNQLSVNLKKTNYIVFGTKNINLDFDIQIDNVPIERVNNTKFLGVYIDAQLNWAVQLNIVKSKIAKGLGILYRLKYKLTEDAKLILYSTLILPHLTYCCSVWGNTCKSRLNNIVTLQKKATEIVS